MTGQPSDADESNKISTKKNVEGEREGDVDDEGEGEGEEEKTEGIQPGLSFWIGFCVPDIQVSAYRIKLQQLLLLSGFQLYTCKV